LSLFYSPDDATSTASVLLDPRGNVAYISEKPVGAHQDYMTVNPIYAFTPDILAYLDKVPVMEDSGERVLATAVQMMIDDERLVGAVPAEVRTRLDTPQDLLEVNLSLLQEPEAHTVQSEVPSMVEIISPVHIEHGVSLGQGAVIGPNVYLETRTVVGANSKIENTVILGRTIRPDSQIAHELVSGDR
jgi:NDP-sugar pyrophosphorylase family protein